MKEFGIIFQVYKKNICVSMIKLKDLFENREKFITGVELVTTRGIIQQENGQKLVKLAEDLSKDPKVDWISFTENAGGNPMISNDHMGRKVLGMGENVILNITCKDKNRNALESTAWKYASEGFENLLALSGDYPIDGYNGIAKGVFDIDSVGLLQMLKNMNRGLKIKGRKPGSTIELDKTDFFLGCTVSPFKLTEAEQMMQYEKLKMKVRAGADFIIPQLGYDIRKSHELLCFMKENNISLPVVGNIYRLNAGIARMFNKGMFPGCVVSDALLERIDQEKKSVDKGKAYFNDLAAKQVAAFKGMGYKGVYIGGINKYSDFAEIIEKAEEFKDTVWHDFVPELTNPQKNEYYYYGADKNTNLSDPGKINGSYSVVKRSRYSKHVTPGYRFSRVMHALVFDYKAPLFGLLRAKYNTLEKKGFGWLRKFYYFIERMSKATFFLCKECGDCSLPDITYLCPESQCAKNQRNGPCGGSRSDMCEVTRTGRYCIWVKAYTRNRYFNGNKKCLLDRRVVIKNNELDGTSGWANCFLLRDHNAYIGEQVRSKKS